VIFAELISISGRCDNDAIGDEEAFEKRGLRLRYRVKIRRIPEAYSASLPWRVAGLRICRLKMAFCTTIIQLYERVMCKLQS
jgi:hypothetical protein